MGRSSFLAVLLVSLLLILSFSKGFGRKVKQTSGLEENATALLEENTAESRAMIELDYVDPEPNPNTKSGYLFTPPPLQD